MSLLEEAKESKKRLRFGLHFVNASEIAEQFYCEKKVELKYTYGKIQTQEMEKGDEKHELTLSGMIPVKREDLWRDIFQKPTVGASMLLLGKYRECVIAGRPDYILFRRRKPTLLIEYKFSRKPKIFPSYHVQALVYGYLLHDLGFETSELRYAISVAPHDLNREKIESLNQTICMLSIPELYKKEPVDLDIPGLVVWMYPFSLESAIEKLEWAIPFWEERRNAKPTRKAEKCGACGYREKCTKAAPIPVFSSHP